LTKLELQHVDGNREGPGERREEEEAEIGRNKERGGGGSGGSIPT
jgi:hypothetical protein